MNITMNNAMIFVKTDDNGKVHYKVGLSSKKQDGTYDNAYIDVRIPKGVQLENKTKINISKGFLSFYNYKGKDGKQNTIWYIVIQEFTKQEQLKEQNVYVVESYKAEDLELPF